MSTKLRMLIPVYDNFNILDVGGPLDVFRNYALRSLPTQFDITVTGPTKSTMAYEGAAIMSDYTFDDVIAEIKQDKFDMLLVPGCGPNAADAALKDTSILNVMNTFIATNPKNKPKWLISICTGAMVLQATGIFAGQTVTTHFSAISSLQEKLGKTAHVVRQRWVDAGVVKGPNGGTFRLVTSGGISCGLDCSLYVVAEVYQDMTKAIETAYMMDYNWNFGCTPNTTPANPCVPILPQP